MLVWGPSLYHVRQQRNLVGRVNKWQFLLTFSIINVDVERVCAMGQKKSKNVRT